MKRILSPSVLSADFAILGEQLKALKACGVTNIHYDVMDGMYVPSISFGMPVLKSIRIPGTVRRIGNATSRRPVRRQLSP